MTSDFRARAGRRETSVDLVDAVRRGAVVLVLLGGSMLVLGLLGRVVVFGSVLGDAEADLVAWVAGNRNDAVNSIATASSALSDTWTVIGILIGAVTVLVATGHGRFAAFMLVAMGFELTVFAFVGEIIDRTRPSVDALHSVPSTPSFPSGHVAAAIVLYGSLALFTRRVRPSSRAPAWIWIVPVAVVTAVGFSRIYEGVHYPTDVLGGAILGVGALVGAAYVSTAFGSPLSSPAGSSHAPSGEMAAGL